MKFTLYIWTKESVFKSYFANKIDSTLIAITGRWLMQEVGELDLSGAQVNSMKESTEEDVTNWIILHSTQDTFYFY